MNCPICGKLMIGREIIDFPKRYTCPDNHCILTVDSRYVMQWYDSNGKNFTPISSNLIKKDIEK